MNLKGGALTAFNVFADGIKITDVTDVKLPDREAMTVTLNGTGIAGEVNMPLKGKFASTECGFTVGTPVQNAFLTRPGYINLAYKGNMQKIEPLTGLAVDVAVKIEVRCIFKQKTGGNFKVGEGLGQEYTYEVVAWKEYNDNIMVFHVDKINNIYFELGTAGNIAEKINIGEL